jgi:hypothetical protein
MPRPRVDPLQRRRVAQACQSCKRRKEKCDGNIPCRHCKGRKMEQSCQYSSRYSRNNTMTSRSDSSSQPLLREETVDYHSPSNDMESFLDRSIEDYARHESSNQSDTIISNSTAPVPKLSRMLRDEKGKFSRST